MVIRPKWGGRYSALIRYFGGYYLMPVVVRHVGLRWVDVITLDGGIEEPDRIRRRQMYREPSKARRACERLNRRRRAR